MLYAEQDVTSDKRMFMANGSNCFRKRRISQVREQLREEEFRIKSSCSQEKLILEDVPVCVF